MSDYEGIQFLIERRKYNQAISKLRELLASSPNNGELYYLLSVCYTLQKKYAEGKEYIQKALELEPTAFEIYNQYAEIEIELKNYVQAKELLKQSSTLEPNDETVFLLWSRLHLENFKFNEAVQNAKKALSLAPDNNYAKNIIALDLILDFKYAEAEEVVNQLLQADPLDSFSLCNLALIQLQNNQVKESNQTIKSALANDPDNEGLKEILKHVIVSKNKVANLFFKFQLFTFKQEKVTRLVIRICYWILLAIGVVLYIDKDGIELLAVLVIILLLVYDFLFVPYKILPQLFNMVLYFDRIGRHLINKWDVFLVIGTIVPFVLGISVLSHNFINLAEPSKYLLILGLFTLFLSGLPTDLVLSLDRKNRKFIISFVIWAVGIGLAYACFPVAGDFIMILMLISLWVYPLMLKAILGPSI